MKNDRRMYFHSHERFKEIQTNKLSGCCKNKREETCFVGFSFLVALFPQSKKISRSEN